VCVCVCVCVCACVFSIHTTFSFYPVEIQPDSAKIMRMKDRSTTGANKKIQFNSTENRFNGSFFTIISLYSSPPSWSSSSHNSLQSDRSTTLEYKYSTCIMCTQGLWPMNLKVDSTHNTTSYSLHFSSIVVGFSFLRQMPRYSTRMSKLMLFRFVIYFVITRS